jgi:hypothetical protein
MPGFCLKARRRCPRSAPNSSSLSAFDVQPQSRGPSAVEIFLCSHPAADFKFHVHRLTVRCSGLNVDGSVFTSSHLNPSSGLRMSSRASLPRRLVPPKSDEGGSELKAGAANHPTSLKSHGGTSLCGLNRVSQSPVVRPDLNLFSRDAIQRCIPVQKPCPFTQDSR